MGNFMVDAPSLDKHFPRTMEVPPLLRVFAQWVAELPRGSLGHFESLAGGKFSDSGLSRAANKTIAAAVGIFMTFGEGSELALWRHDDGPPAVVLIDSEGQHRTVAGTLEAFLTDVSKRRSDTELDGRDGDDAPPQRHQELAAWLRAAKVKVPEAKGKLPDFGAWVTSLIGTDAPPSSSGLPAPGLDMATRTIAALGKPASDPAVVALLAELGIDLKKYKTADALRALLVPLHGYALSIEGKKLKSVEFTNQGYSCWDPSGGADATFAAFPHEVVPGVRTTSTVKAALSALGPPSDSTPAAGLYYYVLPGSTHVLVKGADEDYPDDLPADAIRFIKFVRI